MTTCLRAVSVGCEVPRADFEAAVHSVFRSALNLQPARGGLLVTLLLSSEADLPQGIRLDAPRGFIFEGLPPAGRAACRDGVLVVGDAFAVDLRAPRAWRCDLSPLNANWAKPDVVAAWRQAWGALRERKRRVASVITTRHTAESISRYDSLLNRRLYAVFERVLRATRAFDLAGMTSLDDLVGLGTGLTPGGDDLVVGYLAGLWCDARGSPERTRFLAEVGKLVTGYSIRTNDIARTFLCLVARGQVSSRLVDLAAAICSGEGPGEIRQKSEAAMSVGHSSGMHAVNGLLLGMAAWDGPQVSAWEPLATAITRGSSHTLSRWQSLRRSGPSWD